MTSLRWEEVEAKVDGCGQGGGGPEQCGRARSFACSTGRCCIGFDILTTHTETYLS
jgi:hypothetical protein